MRDLEGYLRSRLRDREILLMTHIVLGYPTFDDSLRVVEAMVEAGVDLMELQMPFSEPIADGPVILRANQISLTAGARVSRCLDTAAELARRFDIPFLVMSYYNILFRRGVREFASQLAAAGVAGAIVPDLPPEEAGEYLEAMAGARLDPIFIFSPNTSDARMREIARHARGFVYCVARKGVTGADTDFSAALDAYLARCHAATRLPLAVGFGVKETADVDALRGKAEIAVVGTQTIRVLESGGVPAVRSFVGSLRVASS
jgi:tryptophan synthase alpha chain